ncbi:DUF3800 domain-containing protein [Herbidospora yilanensis]|uniref:DUF3800 domain-containing protein n=1 Tax=Herbidospora yilanensis TaxID=354426 RepID=UPI0007829F5C|nr:DUF3800 domain-containing protein [Herbidospora yilanensis]
MQFCYLDEAGGCEPPDLSPAATPAMVILGLVVNAASIPLLTRDFLALKRQYFPNRFDGRRALDHILVEIKGSEILQMTRSDSRNKRRVATRFRGALLDLVEAHGCRLLGRVWIKEPGRSMSPDGSYCSAVQLITTHFNQYMQVRSDIGMVIADSRQSHTNRRVAHSIFTQKWRSAGDPYPALRDVPLFACSDNHAGLQIADLIASTLVFPMAIGAYCARDPRNAHTAAVNRYAGIGSETIGESARRSAERIKDLQFRYRDEMGHWRGGITVSDAIGKRPGSLLFAP